MKFAILMHSHPEPWGHPTGDFVAEQQAQPAAEREEGMAAFGSLLDELSSSGELIGGAPLDDPTKATLFRVVDGHREISQGPYSTTGEHLAGYFVIDVADADRATQIAQAMSGPGETVELRPIWG